MTEAQEHGTLIEEHFVETMPSRVPDFTLDAAVDLNTVQKYFTSDGWLAVTATMSTKKRTVRWKCAQCKDMLNDDPSIICELCLSWFHQECSGVKKCQLQSAKSWFCVKCSSMHI